MKSKTVLIKHSAIGDVALACAALKQISKEFELRLELHWVIDRTLQPMAESLLKFPEPIAELDVKWHCIDATKLFKGSTIEKLKEAANISKTFLLTQPRCGVILHRDLRYYAFARPAFTGSILQISHENIHELELYKNTLRKMCDSIGLNPSKRSDGVFPRPPSKRVGILVGGGQNSKTAFPEKRWPTTKYTELVGYILEGTDFHIQLLGGPSDVVEASEIERKYQASGRIQNLAGKTSLGEMPAVLAGLDAFVGVDSGLAHIAAGVMTASNQRIVSLFGPTNPSSWAPRKLGANTVDVFYKGTPCSPCYKNDGKFTPCIHKGTDYFQYCMADIAAADVFKALLSQSLRSPL